MMRSMYCGVENGFGRRAMASSCWMQRETVSTLCRTILLLSSTCFSSSFTSSSAVNFLFNSASYFCLMASDEVACFSVTYSQLYG